MLLSTLRLPSIFFSSRRAATAISTASKVDAPNIAHLCEKARLALTPDEVIESGPQIGRIVDWMAIEATPPSPVVPLKSNTQDGPLFSLRIVNLEYYLSPPLPCMDVCYSKFQGRTVTEVPVVRIYGATPAGQKACLHLHQVFPYFYVPYDDDLPQDISDALAYVRCLASAIEKAMKLASSNAAKKQHVHSCSLVRARKYYGYHPSEQLFIKIVLYHPQEVARISTLLLGGGIMNRKFQPHESHISYLLQLLIDQNLAGMGYIHLSTVKFRRPIPNRPSDTRHVIQQLKDEFVPTSERSQEKAEVLVDLNRKTSQIKEASMETTPPPATNECLGSGVEGRSQQALVWVESSIPAHWVWPSHFATGGPFGRHSTCELEADASVEDILNRQELAFMPLHEAGPAIKLVQSLTPMWEEERLRTGENGPAGENALRPSPDRCLPPPSALEHALRDSLFQIVQDEERFHDFELQNELLLKSTQDMLLECSQAANTARSGDPKLDTKSIGVQEWPEDEDGFRSSGDKSVGPGSQDELVNEHVIRTQLTQQGLVSQEAEDEVMELLEWMGASQPYDMGESGDELDEQALEIGRGLSQTWESPTMEAAMLQALSKFEQATQKECQEILDCVNHEECEYDENDEDLEAALLEIDFEDVAIVQRGRTRLAIPQTVGASDAACENPSPRAALDRYTEHLNTLNTSGVTKDPQVNFWANGDPIHIVQKDPRIPQNDGANDEETESGFRPEPKRKRLDLHRSVPGSKKEGHDRKEKDVSKRNVWGLLPVVGASSQPTSVKHEKEQKEQKVSTNNKRVLPEFGPRRPWVSDVAGRGQGTEPLTDDKTKGSEVSLRALMRRKRERRMRSKESSLSGGSSILGSQSEGEQSFGGLGIVRSQSSVPDDSESQEQELMKQSIMQLGKANVKGELVAVDHQGNILPRDVASNFRDAEEICRSSQDVGMELGRRTTLQQIGTLEDAVDEKTERRRSLDQCPETNQLPLKVKNLSVKWDGLVATGDDRDCGGGRKLHAENSALPVQNPGGSKSIPAQSGSKGIQVQAGSKSIQVQSQVVEDEVWLGEDAPLTQVKESKDLSLHSSPDPADEKEGMLEYEGLDVLRQINSKLVEVTSQAWSEVVKEITKYSLTKKATVHNIQASSSDVNLSKDVGNVTPQKNASSGSVDVTHLAEISPLKVLPTQMLDLGSDKDFEHKAHFIETQLVEHEILWRMKHEVHQACEDEFLGTILVQEREDAVDDLSQVDISINVINPGLVSEKTGILGYEVYDRLKESPPKQEGTEAPKLLFTDMSDSSEDSFDWGDEFGGSERLDDGDDGADAAEDDELRPTLPENNTSNIKPELSTHLDGVPPVLKGEDMAEQQAAEFALKECGDKLNETFSSKSRWQVVQAKLGVGNSKLDSEPDEVKNSLLGPEAIGLAEEAYVCTSNAERESAAVLDAATSRNSGGMNSSPRSRECGKQEVKDDGLIPVKFHQKPPSRDAVMSTLGQYNLRDVDYGGVFYGNSEDVPGRATVSAGLVFDVKSKNASDLPPFVFGAENKKSRFSTTRAEPKSKPADLRPGMGVPCHFENDGSVSYLLTPAKPPPTRLAVEQWLSENQNHGIDAQKKHSSSCGERVFTMDANTGKLVPMDEAGSNRSTQESLPLQEDMEFFRPASPKYDEKHVLASPILSKFPGSQEYAVSSKRSSRRYSNVQKTPGSKPLHLNPLVSSRASTPGNTLTSVPEAPQVSNSKSLQTSVQNEKNMTAKGSQELPINPPSLAKNEVKKELPKGKISAGTSKKDTLKSALRWRDVSQITAPSPLKGQLTPLSQSGFRDPESVGAGQQITLMSIEVHSETRGNLRPDPRYDAVGMVVVDIRYDDETRGHLSNQTLVLLVDAMAASSSKNVDGVTGCNIIYLPDEPTLLKCFIRLVRLSDPDMLVGWEIQGCSLGLLAERAANLGVGLLKELSRTPPKPQPQHTPQKPQEPQPDSPKTDPELDAKRADPEPKVQELRNSVFSDMVPLEAGVTDSVITDEWGRTTGSGLFVGGRIIMNLWRIMRGEVKLGIYTLEAVAEAVLRRRVPRIPWRSLTRWFASGPARGRHRCVKYFVDRAKLNFEIMDQLDLLNRTSELARVFGIDFYSVFSRGSQYRVESMMLRLAHTQNFLLLSPSRQQVAAQPAMECLPLVMEPESRFYTSPVVVLDFQSLYPSMIIAYNLCFSTCLGKIVSNNPKVLGVTNLPIPPGLLRELKDLLTVTPNGVLYTPSEIRQGVVPRLLSEILSTRIMVKQAMKKLSPDQKVLQRVLNARQFALKLIANVTYGYTAAGFSGRMPCAELADSIVQCGRLTLERAIHLVNTTKRWDARVVYGDTDSMFVHLEGRTREEAFRIGQEIAASVTAMNPTPVTLKMEKVYHPCVLLTKKRYVGYSYESPGQASPTFDAKGIETIRRDSCAAVAKTLERSLRTLFETQDLSQVKSYLQRQWGKIISGRVSLRDFIFAKEVRLGTYSARASVLPAAAIVASKAMSLDPRAEPRYAERVPYVVVHGEPGARLSDVVVDPHVMLANGLRLHDTYYITKQIIPALQRVFGLVGADLRQWFAELPRVYRPSTSKRAGIETDRGRARVGLVKGTIDHYYLSQHCSVCGELMRGSQLVCGTCACNPQAVVVVLTTQTAQLEKDFKHLEAMCRHCDGGDGGPEGHIACVSLDCPIFFERSKVQKEFQALSTVSANCGYYPTCFLDFGSELF